MLPYLKKSKTINGGKFKILGLPTQPATLPRHNHNNSLAFSFFVYLQIHVLYEGANCGLEFVLSEALDASPRQCSLCRSCTLPIVWICQNIVNSPHAIVGPVISNFNCLCACFCNTCLSVGDISIY